MKAVTWRAYGPPEVLRMEETPVPVPSADQVLVRVPATTVTASDAMLRRGESAAVRMIVGLREPRRRYQVPGLELAGVVEATGRRVTRFRSGDEVYGFTGFRLGACAEYACLPERASLAIKPSTLNYGEAAALVDGATTALYFLQDKAHLRSGQRVLVLGASGSIGGYAVQLARHLGAEVAATASTSNLELVRSLGAHRAIDYTREEVTTGSERYDVIFDAVGASSFASLGFQIVRGVLFGLALLPLRRFLAATRLGWLWLWLVFVSIGILGTPAAAPGSLEGVIYSRLPLWFHAIGLPEILLQTLAFSYLVHRTLRAAAHPLPSLLGTLLNAVVVACISFLGYTVVSLGFAFSAGVGIASGSNLLVLGQFVAPLVLTFATALVPHHRWWLSRHVLLYLASAAALAIYQAVALGSTGWLYVLVAPVLPVLISLAITRPRTGPPRDTGRGKAPPRPREPRHADEAGHHVGLRVADPPDRQP